MTRRTMLGMLLIALAISGAPAMAHDDYRIIGTITKVAAKTLDVKQTKDGKIISMDMDDNTIFTRDKKKVDRKELKSGLSVVVDARGDSIDELLVVEVRIVPSTSKQ